MVNIKNSRTEARRGSGASTPIWNLLNKGRDFRPLERLVSILASGRTLHFLKNHALALRGRQIPTRGGFVGQACVIGTSIDRHQIRSPGKLSGRRLGTDSDQTKQLRFGSCGQSSFVGQARQTTTSAGCFGAAAGHGDWAKTDDFVYRLQTPQRPFVFLGKLLLFHLH